MAEAQTYIALFRGLNVGTSKRIKMAALRQCFIDAGAHFFESYIQSGNVAFGCNDPDKFGSELAQRLGDHLDQVPDFLVINFAQYQQICTAHPCSDQTDDERMLHVTFLNQAIDQKACTQLRQYEGTDTMIATPGTRAIYLHTPHGYSKTKLTNERIARICGCIATTRNWRSCGKILEMGQRCQAAPNSSMA